MKKTKLKLNKQTVRILAADLVKVVGGVTTAETEPYSFCTLCEPYTIVGCR